MPKNLEQIVQSMIDSDESEDNIAAVIKEYKTSAPDGIVTPQEPDTFASGVMNSIMGGDAIKAGLKGAGGFFRGAIEDLPSSLMNAAQMFSSPDATGKALENMWNEGLPAIANKFRTAGSDPEGFGRMMGQMTGQPLVTAGLTSGIPMGTRVPGMGALDGFGSPLKAGARMSGTPIEGIGNFIANHKPMSGMLPKLLEGRTAGTVEGMIGRGISNIGKRLQSVPKVVNGEIVEPINEKPAYTEGRFRERTSKEVAKQPAPQPPQTRATTKNNTATTSLPPAVKKMLDPHPQPRLSAPIVRKLLDAPKFSRDLPPVPTQKLLGSGRIELPPSEMKPAALQMIERNRHRVDIPDDLMQELNAMPAPIESVPLPEAPIPEPPPLESTPSQGWSTGDIQDLMDSIKSGSKNLRKIKKSKTGLIKRLVRR